MVDPVPSRWSHEKEKEEEEMNLGRGSSPGFSVSELLEISESQFRWCLNLLSFRRATGESTACIKSTYRRDSSREF